MWSLKQSRRWWAQDKCTLLLLMLLTLMPNRAGIRMLPCWTPISCLHSFDRAHSNFKRTFKQEVPNKHIHLAPETKIPEIYQNAVLPHHVTGFFKVKENSKDMLFVNKAFIINVSKWTRWPNILPETTLLLKKETLWLKGPHEASIDHSLHFA